MKNLYINSAIINLFNGIFNETVNFQNGFNIISGENGTGKTRLLTYLKTNGIITENDQGILNASQIRVLAFSPKRNSEKKTVETAFEQFRQQNRKHENLVSEALNRQVQDSNFETYPPFGELFASYFELLDRKGGNRKRNVEKVKNEFDKVMKKFFPSYGVKAVWDESRGVPLVLIEKNGFEITLQDLSCGEQEILSLIFNLYISRTDAEVFLIDEPEVHLNWSLELTLFKFLDDFCVKYKKQIIIVTHSRVMFLANYYKKSQFLVWENGKIVCKKEIDKKLKDMLAGETLSLSQIVKIDKPTFFVEDQIQELVIAGIGKILNKDISVVSVQGKTNVKSMFKLAKGKHDYELARFVIDSDNDGNPFTGEPQFIFLNKYCMECYLIDIASLKTILGKNESQIKKEILEIIKKHKKDILSKYKHLDFVIDRIVENDINEKFLSKFDCSCILPTLIKNKKIKLEKFVESYIKQNENKLDEIFETNLLSSIKNL